MNTLKNERRKKNGLSFSSGDFVFLCFFMQYIFTKSRFQLSKRISLRVSNQICPSILRNSKIYLIIKTSMDIIVKLFYALFLMGLGFSLIRYRKNVKSWTGNFFWAEKYLGNGGTYLVMILLGLFLIFLWVLYPFGGLDLLFGSSPLNFETPAP